jgi:actin-related protein
LIDPAAYLSQGGAVQDWDAYEHLWESAMETMSVRRHKHSTGEPTRHSKDAAANTNSNSNKEGLPASTTIRPTAPEYQCMHPLMALTPGFTYPSLAPDGSYRPSAVKAARRQEMVKTLELLLETFDAPAAFLAPEPMVAAFSQGRSIALVVDVGAGGSRVTPVVDGLVLSHGQRRSGRGGDWLLNNAWQGLQAVTPLRPRYQLQLGVVDPTIQARGIFHRWAMQDVVWECTSAISRMPLASATTQPLFAPTRPAKKKAQDEEDADEEEEDPMETDETPANAAPTSTFELPDGTLVDLTTPTARDLCRLPEAYFLPTLPFGTTAGASMLAQHDSLTDLPLDQLIRASLLAVADVDVRKDLAANILLVGGASLGLEERLSWQLRHILPGKPKVLASAHSIERTAASWIGGSILSSLGSFQQLWLGRTEYEEYGPALALQRFPV